MILPCVRSHAHITIAADQRPSVIKRHGVTYIVAPNPTAAAETWLKLLEEEE